jgi:hypothetical protein
MIRKKYTYIFILFVLIAGVMGQNLFPTGVAAISASNWQAGRIIDDSIFTDSSSMTASQIQTFLNNLVPNCDTYGTQPATEWGRSDLTHAQYAQTQGWAAPPYVCLKNYYEVPKTSPGLGIPDNSYNHNGNAPSGSISAAQMIYNAAQQYNISPKVLLIKIRSESSGPLTTDSWPLQSQYTYAMGAHCPDSGPGNSPNCDPNYAGFSIQISESAALLRYYIDNMSQPWWPYKKVGSNVIQYSPTVSCGSSAVSITTSATAALYTYTPYQPNAAALAAGYGTAPCGAYGNRNFWLYYNDWFGSSTDDSLLYSVIQGPNSPALYLQTPAGKYYIPTLATMQDWGIQNLPVQQVSQAYIDGLTTNSWLGRLLVDDWGNYFMVDNGTIHYIRNASYLPLWGLSANTAVHSLGLVYSMQDTTWAGRFVQDQAQPTGSIYLLDNGTKRLVPNTTMLYNWRYTPDMLTTVSAAYLSSIPTGANVTQYATDGTTSYVVDSGQRLSLAGADVQNAFYGSQTAGTYDPSTLSFLPTTGSSPFVVDTTTGQWFMLENGKKHYIASLNLAQIWGQSATSPTIPLSDAFLSTLTDGGDLTYVVQTASPSQYWLIDGKKHYIASTDVAQAWLAPNTTPPIYSSQSLDLLAQGPNATTEIHAGNSPYTYEMDNGIKHYLMTASAQNAWGNTVMGTSDQLVASVPEGVFVNYLVKDPSGNAYLLMNGQLYPIDPSYYDVWGVGSTTPTISAQAVSRYPVATTLKAFIRIGSASYVMTQGGNKTPINTYADTYQITSLGATTLPNDYFNTTDQASYLVKSSDPTNTGIWLIRNGSKMTLTGEQAITYGYLSRGVPLTSLSPATLTAIPNDSAQPSFLIQSQSSGIKLLSFGYGLGFSDGDTLNSYMGPSNQTLQVSPSIFNAFALKKGATRLVVDDQGNYYWMDGGAKHHIPTLSVLAHYRSVSATYLEGTTMNLIPLGSEQDQ